MAIQQLKLLEIANQAGKHPVMWRMHAEIILQDLIRAELKDWPDEKMSELLKLLGAGAKLFIAAQLTAEAIERKKKDDKS
jgi:hypothetical protein